MPPEARERDIFDNIADALREAYHNNLATESDAAMITGSKDGNPICICFTQTTYSSTSLERLFNQHWGPVELTPANEIFSHPKDAK